MGFASSALQKYKKFFLEKIQEVFKLWVRNFHFPKYKKNFQIIIFFIFWARKVSCWNFLILGLESSISQNIRNFFLRKHKKVFNLRAKKYHYQKYKKNIFWKNIRNFFREYFFYFLIFYSFFFRTLAEEWPRWLWSLLLSLETIMPYLVSLSSPSAQILDKIWTDVLSTLRFLVKFLVDKNCLNFRTSNGIDIKPGRLSKLG